MIKKYSNKVLDNIKFKQDPIALLCIANELAEANRLKRLELINTLPDGISEDIINGDDK